MATETGLLSVSAVALVLNAKPMKVPVVKLLPARRRGRPQVSLVRGVRYSSTRLLLKSTTKRSPEVSTATSVGRQRLEAVIPPRLQVLDVKLPPRPNTRSVKMSVVSGVLYSRHAVCSPGPRCIHFPRYRRRRLTASTATWR